MLLIPNLRQLQYQLAHIQVCNNMHVGLVYSMLSMGVTQMLNAYKACLVYSCNTHARKHLQGSINPLTSHEKCLYINHCVMRIYQERLKAIYKCFHTFTLYQSAITRILRINYLNTCYFSKKYHMLSNSNALSHMLCFIIIAMQLLLCNSIVSVYS